VSSPTLCSKPASQNRDQQDNYYEAEAAAAVVAGAVKGSPPTPLKPLSNAMIRMMSKIVPADMTLFLARGGPRRAAPFRPRLTHVGALPSHQWREAKFLGRGVFISSPVRARIYATPKAVKAGTALAATGRKRNSCRRRGNRQCDCHARFRVAKYPRDRN
jgi:hypothetical protein